MPVGGFAGYKQRGVVFLAGCLSLSCSPVLQTNERQSFLGARVGSASSYHRLGSVFSVVHLFCVSTCFGLVVQACLV